MFTVRSLESPGYKNVVIKLIMTACHAVTVSRPSCLPSKPNGQTDAPDPTFDISYRLKLEQWRLLAKRFLTSRE